MVLAVVLGVAEAVPGRLILLTFAFVETQNLASLLVFSFTVHGKGSIIFKKKGDLSLNS